MAHTAMVVAKKAGSRVYSRAWMRAVNVGQWKRGKLPVSWSGILSAVGSWQLTWDRQLSDMHLRET
jgi:hypothetical protein